MYLSKKVDKAFFQHDKAYREFKDFSRKTASDKVLDHKVLCHIAKNPEKDWCQRGITAMVHKTFDKKSSGGAVKTEIMQN